MANKRSLQSKKFRRYKRKYVNKKRQEASVHETPPLASQFITDDLYLAANVENAVHDSVPEGTNVSEIAEKITSNLKSSMSDIDLNQDGMVSDGEYEYSLRNRKETFERRLAAGSLIAAVAIVFFVLITSYLSKDSTIYEGLSGILIATISGLLVIPAGYAGIKAFMNGKTDQIAVDNTTSYQPPPPSQNGLNERGM